MAVNSPVPGAPGDEDPIGYAHLIEAYQLDIVGWGTWTFMDRGQRRARIERRCYTIRVVPRDRDPGRHPLDHWLFALRHEGLSVEIARALLRSDALDAIRGELELRLQGTPLGKHLRRAWFLLEELSGARLAIPDLNRGNYVPLADPRRFVVGTRRAQTRQRIHLNLLGDLNFSPVVRRSKAVEAIDARVLTASVRTLLDGYDDQTVGRALSYLFNKETMASFEIERERPAQDRAEKFVALLREAPNVDRLDEETLRELQNAIVDPRYAAAGWRHAEVYVGESIDLVRQRVHFVAPRSVDVPQLMDAWQTLAESGVLNDVDPVLRAAIVSFSFVIIHPFDDGNGRLHRFMVHWSLSRASVTPSDMVIPVSAVMLSRPREYDEALETFSVPLMDRVQYGLDPMGRLLPEHVPVDFYRHPDLTAMTVALFGWLRQAVDEHLLAELTFLQGFDAARSAMRTIVDMPDAKTTLFIKLCRANGDKLSKTKRRRFFEELTDNEVADLQAAVAGAFEAG